VFDQETGLVFDTGEQAVTSQCDECSECDDCDCVDCTDDDDVDTDD